MKTEITISKKPPEPDVYTFDNIKNNTIPQGIYKIRGVCGANSGEIRLVVIKKYRTNDNMLNNIYLYCNTKGNTIENFSLTTWRDCKFEKTDEEITLKIS